MTDKDQKMPVNLPEVLVTSTGISDKVSGAVKRGNLRKIAPRLYSSNFIDSPETIIGRNLWIVVGQLFPGSVVGYRTALEGRPTSDGTVFLSAPNSRVVELPGLTVRLIKGPGPVEGDTEFMGSLWFASKSRALLENLRPFRKGKGLPRSLGRQGVEREMEKILRVQGKNALNLLRDQARGLENVLAAKKEFEQLDALVGALLGTRKTRLRSVEALARASGRPYDPDRIERMQILHADLHTWHSVPRPNRCASGIRLLNVAFWDAYFSNFIEGTEFEIVEAREIIFENKVPASRPADAHDIIGTFRLLSNSQEMSETFAGGTVENFLDAIKRRHSVIMSARDEAAPGKFKTTGNRAGDTVFVSPELVRGTLERGFEIYRSLNSPFARAAFVMFLVAEVHPFVDGNGRVARLMMNGELIAAGETRIIIPTVYRDDYLGALRVLTRQNRTSPFINMLDTAQRFTAAIDFDDLDASTVALETARAFSEPDSGPLKIPD